MVMPRIWTGWNHSRARAALIWVLCFAAFHFLFRMALHNSLQAPVPTPSYGGSSGISTDIPISNTERRFRLYDRMAKDLDEHGAVFLKHGETSQSLSLSELFALVDGAVKPVPKAANPPVRANVLYLSSKYSKPISYEGSTICLTPFRIMYGNYLDHILIKNSSLYHFSMFHASHHISPVPASEDEIEAEATAVRAVADTICPLKIVLDRVVLTSTGVLLGCWQVISGTDPISIRAKLRTALPHAPEKQLYDAAILHTSFARLLGPPKSTPKDLSTNSDQLKFFHELVAQLNKKLGGSEALVSELWYVEEYDVLALAVDGRMKVRRFQLGCTGA